MRILIAVSIIALILFLGARQDHINHSPVDEYRQGTIND
jgi:hypothetical protein